ncbi:aminopeptidase P family protein [Actinocorallia sp. API 0066]|uniref:M24 family metallopeptidase n=1 Tax=Actinocorallia sp. API 0066 TaxID=2896846 RepID=UPI001E5D2E85|nr:aminopeptidase P family protein [Actinocorallia sp. API 0066]MCD0450866.1 aminopeptidase P family protein [Actinocorallia sp. API 0066]
MPQIHERRRAALAARLPAPAALITRLVNVRYLTGLASSHAAVLVFADGRAVLATDARYAGTAAAVAPDLELLVTPHVAAELVDRAGGEVAFEAHDITVEDHAALFENVRAVPLGRLVEELRTVKDEEEIALLRRACALTDRTFGLVLPKIAPGVTEKEIARALERGMVDLGADGPAFASIVASGPNGAVPHHVAGDRPVADGDLVTMDFGALVEGYHADMTRTVAVGSVAGWQREIYGLVAEAQAAAVAACLPDAAVPDVDAAARDVIKAGGHAADFTHGLGHGVGLEIHEAPMLGPTRTGRLTDRVPVTAEPGVYLAGRGGVRIEDTLVVRAGGPELLTQTTKELLVL